MAIGIYRTCPDMTTPKSKLSLFLSIAVLLSLTLAVGCRGFFVNPKLTSLTVNPTTATISQGQTQSIIATGNFDDGSTKNLTGTVSWTSSDPACAQVSTTGVVTAATTVATTCTTTITATSGAFTATATITVTPGTLISITLTALATTVPAGSTVTFTAKGTCDRSGFKVVCDPATHTQDDVTSLQSRVDRDVIVMGVAGGLGLVALGVATYGAVTASPAPRAASAPAWVPSFTLAPGKASLGVGRAF